MHISVVIPTLNEAENISGLLRMLRQSAPPHCEIIVADGGSTDGTPELAESAGAAVLKDAPRGRSNQMNAGAKMASGEVLYFVHADVRPPRSWPSDIAATIVDGAPAGCFSYRFDSDDKLLKINGLATRRNSFLTGGGDQTLFIKKEVFEEMGGFREELCIMEDFDFVWRLKKRFPFKVVPHDAIVSARKYERNGYFKVQLTNLATVLLFRLGVPPERLSFFYKKIINGE